MGVPPMHPRALKDKTKKADRRGATAAGPLLMNTVSTSKDNVLAQLVNTCSRTFCLSRTRRASRNFARDTIRALAQTTYTHSRTSDFNNGPISFHTSSSRAANAMFVFNQSIGFPMSCLFPRSTTP